MKYLLFLIVITSIVLVIPYKKIKWVKKVLCSATFALAIALSVQSIYIDIVNNKVNSYDNITVMATGEKNENSEGTEVWIKGALVDGKWYEADEIFENVWISKDNCMLGWMEFNQPENLTNTIEGKLPTGKKRELIFEGNKWRGKAVISINQEVKNVDLYLNQENSKDISEEIQYVNVVNEIGTENYMYKIVFVVSLIVSFIGSLGLYYINEKKQKNMTNYDVIVTKKHEVWADLLRVVSAFAVVYLHSTCNIYNNFTDNMQLWYKYLYINCFTTFAVPCFFMISGAFVIRKEYNIKKLLTKQIFKLFIPLFIWSTVYIIYRKVGLNEGINIIKSIIKIPFNSQYSHLWFMYPLIGFYFMSPIISYIYYRLEKKLKIYGIIMVSLIPSIISTINILFGISIDMPWFSIGFPELGLFIMGKYIYEHKEKILGKGKICSIGIFIGYSLTVLGSYYISIKSGVPQKDFFQYSRLPVIIFSVSIFMFFISMEPWLEGKKANIKNIIIKLSELSMGIYFSHVIVKEFLGNKIWLFTDNSGRNITMLLGAIFYFAVSLMVCLILSNIPYINCMIGSNKKRKL
ncbi:acyltransferase [Clostridium botulinum]|nr:acyltransferase [Clostridium botulinum]